MLGHVRKTSRLDVGLSVAFAGVAYLVWSLVAGISRPLVDEMIKATAELESTVPTATKVVKVCFVDGGFVIDIMGLAWLIISLILLVFSSRQLISISWCWMSALCQLGVSAIGALIVAVGVTIPFTSMVEYEPGEGTAFKLVSSISLYVLVPVAVVVWVTFLVWLLTDRARLDRRGPSLRDGLRSNIYR